MLKFPKCTAAQSYSCFCLWIAVCWSLGGTETGVSYTVISVMSLSCHYLLFIFILVPVLLLGRVNKTLKKKWAIIIGVSLSVILSNFFSVFLFFSSPSSFSPSLHSFFPFFQFSESRDPVCLFHCSTLGNQHITRYVTMFVNIKGEYYMIFCIFHECISFKSLLTLKFLTLWGFLNSFPYVIF